MNFEKALVLVIFAFVTTSIFAKSPVVQLTVKHDVTLDDCHFTVSDPFRARISVDTESSVHSVSYIGEIAPRARHPFGTWIQFYCEKDSAEKAFESMGMKRDGVHWVISEGGYPSLPEEHVTIYPLHGASWSGAGFSSDQTTGEFDQRMRSFGFCIAGKHQVLCGAVQQVMFLGYPKESTLPQVIKLLQSIEFIDDAPGASDKATSVNQ
jgi:hypothetical protein